MHILKFLSRNIQRNHIFIIFFVGFLCSSLLIYAQKPNIIFIMADDMGYECLSSYGSTSYNTPVLDSLARQGIRFSNCVSQPLCTPSRVKIMTGLYNYRNYDFFGHLNSNQYTFGNIMKEAGYATCIAGKWQLNGLAYKDTIPDWMTRVLVNASQAINNTSQLRKNCVSFCNKDELSIEAYIN